MYMYMIHSFPWLILQTILFMPTLKERQKMTVIICQKISNEKNNSQALLGQQWTFLFENGTCVRRTRHKIYMYISCRMFIVKYTISNVVLSYFFANVHVFMPKLCVSLICTQLLVGFSAQ
jgi:hypothetical protein